MLLWGPVCGFYYKHTFYCWFMSGWRTNVKNVTCQRTPGQEDDVTSSGKLVFLLCSFKSYAFYINMCGVVQYVFCQSAGLNLDTVDGKLCIYMCMTSTN